MEQNLLQWLVVYTKPRWEKKVAELLTRNKIVNYCPLNKVHMQWSDRKKITLQPLFTSYVFVQTTLNQQLDVRKTDGIINFLYWLGKPAVVRDEEIDLIKRFMNEHYNVQLEKGNVRVDDKVRVMNGPLIMREGKVIEVRNKTVKVSLPSLGYSLIAEIKIPHVQILNRLTESSANLGRRQCN